MKDKLKGRRLYCILDLDLTYLKKEPLFLAKDLIKGGADIIQLRAKNFSAKEFVEIGIKIGSFAKKNDILFIINDRVDIAGALEADGVHLGQEDLPVKFARKILGEKKIIGFSTHSLGEIKIAQREDIDYISVGPIFRSPTKPELKPIGLDVLKKAVKFSNLPIVAIGGINLTNLEKALACGIDAIAIITAILSSNNIRETTDRFKKKIATYFNVQ